MTIDDDYDLEDFLGFDYPDWLASNYGSGADVNYQYFYIPADDTTWTIGSELTFWTGYGTVPSLSYPDNTEHTIVFGGASALALAGSAAFAAAALI